MKTRLSIDESAEYLGVSREFVDSMISKGRLAPDAKNTIAVDQLAALAELVAKLKTGGIAAMVSAVDQQL
ncbi:hypothetical protein QWI17_22405 [Gilvimarinus sp. SDUM040013]|uniref:Helix-turn-helix domain-containing protein n=1 Tax=Gilvimarinus gilvus TaxID=3058038 RepID=A0ABU4RX85_9GAMM|nr:hypothetical protein [Gilvimarinus sp. SDUM040013]MDO3388615.1 hypothetical protein [Gilvimarinus sp. SDUM040013]MDX6849510.1 hypothetical protein [Gilvimarinus sp. SDUM040013]